MNDVLHKTSVLTLEIKPVVRQPYRGALRATSASNASLACASRGTVSFFETAFSPQIRDLRSLARVNLRKAKLIYNRQQSSM